MMDTYLRKPYQTLCIDPILFLFPKIKTVAPNTLTLCGAVLGGIAGGLVACDQPVFAIIFLLASGYFDTLDGSVARLSEKASPTGAVLDIFCDRCVEFTLILGLYLVDPLSRGFLSLLMLGSILLCITSFLAVGIFEKNRSEKSFHYSPGWMERSEAFLFFIAMVIFPSFFSPLALAFTVLVAFTAFFRIYETQVAPQ